MKVIKNINNNICLCLDSRGREVIAFGKGIGFQKPPYEIPLEKINRTFVNVKDNDFSTLKNLPVETINTAIRIIDEASLALDTVYPSSAILAMADHIQFAIDRGKENIWIDLPIVQDIKILYPKEMEIAFWALKLINRVLNAELMRNEAAAIALHLINDRQQPTGSGMSDKEAFIESAIQAVEQCMNIQISRDSFNCSRFVIHLDYLLKRLFDMDENTSQNSEPFRLMTRRFPQAYEVVRCISEMIQKKYGVTLSEDEQFYLLIYVRRLSTREEDTKKG